MDGDDALSAAQAAKLLGVDEDWINARKFRGPCSLSLKTSAVTILRRDLTWWAEMRDAERIELRRPAPPTPSPDQVDAMGRIKATAARFGSRSRWM